MTNLKFVVEVQIERESGLFAPRDEISEKVEEAINEGLEQVDLTGLGANSDSEYAVSEITIEEVDNKGLRDLWRDSQRRVAAEMPGDPELRNKVKSLTHEVREKVEAIRRLQREIEKANEKRETGRTSVYLQEGFESPREYLPDGQYDRVYYQFGDHEQERFGVTRQSDGALEIRMDTMGRWDLAVMPQSGNVFLVRAVDRN